MSAIKRHKILYNASAAGTGDGVRLANRFEIPADRVVQADMTAGDHLFLEATSMDVRGSISDSYLADLTAADITILSDITATGNYEIDGPWSWVRVRKTGTNGVGKVQGFI